MENDIISFIKESEKEYSKEFNSGKYYNIFNELSITTDEVKHSSFLKSLIDPNGLHGCGNLFYLSFLEKIGIDINKDVFAWLQDYKNINIYAEYFIGNRDHKNDTYTENYYGRIDLLIEHSKLNKALVIENKIHAKDQPQQLKRYFDFSNKKYGKINEDFWLYYLTLDNKEPELQSYQGIKKESIISISYETEIVEWLENCLNSHLVNGIVQPLNNNIQFSVNQYLKIIRQLTNQSNNINTQLLLNKYSNLSTYNIIGKRDDLRRTFFTELFAILKQKLPNTQIEFVTQIHNKVNNIETTLKTNSHSKNFGIRIGSKNENCINIEVQDWTRLIYGVFNPNKESDFCKKIEQLGFTHKPWWLQKEYAIKNSTNIQFPFYDDNLNFVFLTQGNKLAEKFAKEVLSLTKEITS